VGEIVAIALGGSLGAIMRYWLSNAVYLWLGRGFPYGTLSVNVIGSFIIGIAFILLTERLTLGAEARAFILIGFLGSFTTFSTFSLETLILVQQGLMIKAVINIVISVMLCLIASWGGMNLARAI
jgi:CrcB protein